MITQLIMVLWRCATRVSGVASANRAGMMQMLRFFVDNWDIRYAVICLNLKKRSVISMCFWRDKPTSEKL